MRVVFMGSPEFAVPSLSALLPVHDVVAVVTQPDKPAGRGRKLMPPAVKQRALEAGVKVLQPTSARKAAFAEELAAFRPDAAVVVAYGKILPQRVLDVPVHGCFNVHASLLPRYRGAAPIQRAVMDGEAGTGVTIMRLDAGMDTGPMCLQGRVAIDEDVTSGQLHDRLSVLGANLMLETLEALQAGRLECRAQVEAEATHAAMLDKEDGRVPWSDTAARVHDRIRAVDPWPGAFTTLEGEPLKMWSSQKVQGHGAPGEVLGPDAHGLVVACGEGAVSLAELQLPGRRRMAAHALLSGRPIAAGTRLGT